MACKPETIAGLKEPADCKCYGAVLRTYNAMKKSECPETVAREAAIRVYRFHHPEDPKNQAALTVETWLHAERLH